MWACPTARSARLSQRSPSLWLSLPTWSKGWNCKPYPNLLCHLSVSPYFSAVLDLLHGSWCSSSLFSSDYNLFYVTRTHLIHRVHLRKLLLHLLATHFLKTSGGWEVQYQGARICQGSICCIILGQKARWLSLLSCMRYLAFIKKIRGIPTQVWERKCA